MSAGMYIDPEQLTKDRADFARRGISRGLTVAAVSCSEGIVVVALNASASLKKIGEVHDRIAFAAVGKYHEFEALRVGAIRWADSRAFQYSRQDVSVLSLANALAQAIGASFTSGLKPLEVELLLTEVSDTGAPDRLLRLGFDGSVADDGLASVIGANRDKVRDRLVSADLTGATADVARLACIDALVAETDNFGGHSGGGAPSRLHVESALVRRRVAGRAFEPWDTDMVPGIAETTADNGDERSHEDETSRDRA